MSAVHQSIERPAGVSVFGSALLRTEPDRAMLALAVARTAPAADEALGQTRAAVRSVRASLAAAGIEGDAVEVSRVSVTDAFEMVGASRRLVGYRAAVGFRVRVADVDAVEAVLVGAVAAGATSVESVGYETSALAELRAQARRTAVANARRKAELYCEAAGVRLGHVIHIEDVDPTGPGSFQRAAHGQPAGPADDAGDTGPLGSGSLSIAAAVVLVFSLLPGAAPPAA